MKSKHKLLKSAIIYLANYLAMGDCIYLSVSHAIRISETSESEFWNILEHSTETVRLERFGRGLVDR